MLPSQAGLGQSFHLPLAFLVFGNASQGLVWLPESLWLVLVGFEPHLTDESRSEAGLCRWTRHFFFKFRYSRLYTDQGDFRSQVALLFD